MHFKYICSKSFFNLWEGWEGVTGIHQVQIGRMEMLSLRSQGEDRLLLSEEWLYKNKSKKALAYVLLVSLQLK